MGGLLRRAMSWPIAGTPEIAEELPLAGGVTAGGGAETSASEIPLVVGASGVVSRTTTVQKIGASVARTIRPSLSLHGSSSDACRIESKDAAGHQESRLTAHAHAHDELDTTGSSTLNGEVHFTWPSSIPNTRYMSPIVMWRLHGLGDDPLPVANDAVSECRL